MLICIMANHRPYTEREKVLDQRLSDGVGYTCKQLMAYCNARADLRGYKPINSKTTLLADLANIENSHHITIKKEKRGREFYYSYDKPGFSIYNNELTSAEVQQLQAAIDVISRFEGLPNFSCMSELQKRFSLSIRPQTKSIVGFAQNEYIEGQEYFDTLFQAIANKRTVRLSYQPFGKDTYSVIVHPYYLKEYNNRWFLFCLGDTRHYISQYAIDRIKQIENAGAAYIESDIDWIEFFENKIGVSGMGEVQPIKIWLSASQLAYATTKPIHGSQKVLQRNDDGSAIIQIEVIPNYEFEQMILSFGEEAMVVEPKEIRDKMESRLTATLKKYQSVHINWTND